MPTLTGDSVRLLLEQVAIDVESNKDFLCDLDGEVGDGDHGVSMTIGMRAVRRAMDDLPPDPSVEQAFQAASDAYAIEVGATIGPLYEVAFAAAAQACSGKADVSSVSDWVQIYQAMFDAIQQLGGAELGDKTLLDSFHPAIEKLASLEGQDLVPSLERCRIAPAIARRGQASFWEPTSLDGHGQQVRCNAARGIRSLSLIHI